MAYALIDYPNDKGVHAAKVMDESELGPDLSNVTAQPANVDAGIIFVDANGEEQEGTKPIRTADVDIDSLTPVPIPAGSYDGTTSAHLTAAAAAEVDGQYIAQGHSILGVNGTLVAQDNLPALLRDTLTSVSDATLTVIPGYAFFRRTAISSASFPAVTTVEMSAFYGCTGLTSLTEQMLPVATTFGDSAFYQTGLTAIDHPVETLSASHTFAASTSLVSANLPDLVTSGTHTFQGCTHLTTVNVPKLQKVPGVFIQSTAVAVLDLPSADEIKATGLGYCSTLKTLILRKDAVVTLENVSGFIASPFASNGTGGTLYVPQDQISQYEQATNWSVILAYTNNQILPIEGSPYEVSA